ncbi:hypothetical protein DFH06DRAFT_1400393 [Mycena polygramma]|nr:hypothetical protein DFH06DRAFT_1400393 [Mycena polygramma]
MPEIFEAGYFFPCYIWVFIVIITLLYGPAGLTVVALWSDLSTAESKESANREDKLVSYSRTLKKTALARGQLAHWASDLQDLAEAIPDTHGLMIHTVWQNLPLTIRKQISPNHESWQSFCDALRALSPGVDTVPSDLPLPWHRRPMGGHIPYFIASTPSKSGLVVRLNRHMPELFRGRNPDPTKQKKRKTARAVTPVQSNVSDSEDEDIDTAVVLEPDDSAQTQEAAPEAAPESTPHGEGTDLSRYFWPRYALPILSSRYMSATDAMAATGMRLRGLVYDARKTIMDLGTVFVEIEPLLHTSPQIYTRRQWDGIKQVPRGHRGFKIGYAFEFPTHTLSWNTFDNNFRTNGNTETSFIGDHPTSTWKITRSLRFRTQSTTILPGIPGWVPMSVIVADKVLFAIICEAFFQFVSSRALKVEEYYRRSETFRPSHVHNLEDIDEIDLSMTASVKHQLQYIQSLRTHGRDRTQVSANEADLIDTYNEASLNTWDENEAASKMPAKQRFFASAKKTDMAKIFFPFDFANVCSSVTKFGHLGPLIAGDYWEPIVSELILDSATLKALEKEYLELPKSLTRDALLFLKPKHLLSRAESMYLYNLWGGQNPIAKYYSQPRFATPCSRIDQSRLTLTSRRTLWRDTFLVKMEKRTGFMWTTLCPPFVSLATRERNTAAKLEGEFKPLYSLQTTELHGESTIKYIKTKTKGWTVGPYDFVGHGQIVKYGSSSFTGLCFWHRDMDAAQMLAMKKAWDARSRYPAGMRKLSIELLPMEKAWRSKTKSALAKTSAAADPPGGFWVKEMRSRRKQERSEIHRLLSTLVDDGGSRKARSLGPRDTARVRNGSQINSLSQKWAQLALADAQLAIVES